MWFDLKVHWHTSGIISWCGWMYYLFPCVWRTTEIISKRRENTYRIWLFDMNESDCLPPVEPLSHCATFIIAVRLKVLCISVSVSLPFTLADGGREQSIWNHLVNEENTFVLLLLWKYHPALIRLAASAASVLISPPLCLLLWFQSAAVSLCLCHNQKDTD